MNDDVVALAPTLRRAWFTTVAAQLEQALPGAWEALSMAAVELTDEGQLMVRVPTVYPVYPPVYELVKGTVKDVLLGALGQSVECVVKLSRGEPRPLRKHPTGLDVYHWGDPHPDDWIPLAAGLVDALSAMEGPAREVFAGAEVTALSQRAIWMRFPTREARHAVGKTPGVAYALKMTVEAWRPGSLLAMYVTDK